MNSSHEQFDKGETKSMDEASQKINSENKPTVQPEGSTFTRRLIWTIPLGLAVGLAVGYSVLIAFVPRYKASSVLAANDANILESRSPLPAVPLSDREADIVISKPVIESVLANPAIARSSNLSNRRRTEQKLRQHLSVESGSNGSVMEISFVDPDPESAAEICNQVVQQYLASRSEMDSRRVSKLIQFLTPQVEQHKQKLGELENKICQLTAEKYSGHNALMFGTQLKELELDRIKSLQGRIDDIEVDIAVIEKAGNPTANSSVAEANDQSETVDDATILRSDPQSELVGLKVRRKALREQHAKLVHDLGTIEGADIALGFAVEDRERTREMLYRMQDRLTQIQIGGRIGDSITVVSEARPPLSPINDMPTRKAAAVVGLGFLIPQLLSFVWGFRSSDPET